ncbi:alpha/beta hydrolase family protein [Spirosoma soli]|uniref:Alpha/beta hydrolase family protein n=1 Tax=Spirosoma soli TaxID=1770529 RepID=A0ABW5M6E0_9BACT
MTRFLIACTCLLLSTRAVVAQTEEPIHHKITVPAGADLTLDGTLTIPDQTRGPVPVVLLIAGSGSTDRDCNSGNRLRTNAYKMLADSLVRQGIAVARYDKRGSGTNLSVAAKVIKPEEHRFDFYVSDALGFIRQLQADKRFSGVVVAGHSEGSLVGMLAAKQANLTKFVSIAGAGRTIADIMKEQLKAGLGDTLRTLSYQILDSLRAGYRVNRVNPFLLSLFDPKNQPGLISWMKYDPAAEIKTLKAQVLLINGQHDVQVPVSEAELLKKARPDAKLVLPDRMNHILKDAPADRTENLKTYNDPTLPLSQGVATAIVQFIKK